MSGAAWISKVRLTETESVASHTSWSLKRRRHHRSMTLILVAAALTSSVELLCSIANPTRGVKVLLSMTSWSAWIVSRRDEALPTWPIAEYFIYRVKGCRLRSCCHLLALQAIVEFLGLLMFAALLSECCHKTLVLSLEPVLVYLHVCSGLVDSPKLITSPDHTVQLLIENAQFGIGVVENFVDLHIESVMLLSHCLHRILLVDAASYQWANVAIPTLTRTSPASTGSSRMPTHAQHIP